MNIAVTFAARLLQEETIKTGFSHESICKLDVFASKKKTVLLPFLLVEKDTTPTNHKIIWQTIYLFAEEQGEVVGGTAGEE